MAEDESAQASDRETLGTELHVLDFPGMAPIPLSRYLKGLGLLRLVAEQRDPDAVGWWQGEQFHLATVLNRGELESFFLDQYRPTPIVTPWNGGSGFYGRDEALSVIANSQTQRWSVYRQTIATARSILSDLDLQGKPDKADKRELVQACRNRLPDEAVAWMDATIVLTASDVAFPPLTGTGGNDGNLEFTNNFMQRLANLMSPGNGEQTPDSRGWLQSSLWGNPAPGLVKGAIGQFSPGEAGGPNASSGFSGDSLVNPWDFVLMLEGVLLFAAATAKRLDSSSKAMLSAPFTVYSSGVGNGSTAETDEGSAARAETWLPMWSKPASLAEVAHLFREGRAQVSGNRVRRNARNGVDFARACATLAVDRGIDSFQRYSFLMRAGKAYLAVPLTRFAVRRQAYAELLTELDTWLDGFARMANDKNAAHSFPSALRRIRQSIFDYCQYGGPRRMQSLLIAVGQAEQLMVHTPRAREGVRPLVLKNPQWWEAAEDASEEFRLAQAFVSLRAGDAGAIRSFLSPVDPTKYWQWIEQEDTARVVWQSGPLTNNLVAVLQRRLLEGVRKANASESPDTRPSTKELGENKPFAGRVSVPLASVLNFVYGRVSDVRLGELIWGLLPLAGVNPPSKSQYELRALQAVGSWEIPVPWAYAVSKLVCSSNVQLARVFGISQVPVPAELIPRLNSGRVEDASHVAVRRLQASGLSSPFFHLKRIPITPQVEGLRLAASLVFPLSTSDLRHLAIRTGVIAEEKEKEVPVLE